MKSLPPLHKLHFWILYYIVKVVRSIVFSILPEAWVEAMLTNLYHEAYIAIETTYKESKSPEATKGYKTKVVVHDPRFFRHVIKNGFLGLGEAYMEGWFDCDNLDDMIGLMATHCGRFEIQEKLEDILDLDTTNQQTKEKSKRVAEEHYDLGNDLYQAMLDPSMNYTCAYWKEDTTTLTQAQINKMDLIARKLHLKPGMKVLDIGCGFGAMAKYLAQNYKVSVVGYNISVEQVKYARESCKGLDVTFYEEDYRNAPLHLDETGKFDRVYSIGFFEAVGHQNFREYFDICYQCMTDEGLHLLHSITFNESHPTPSRNPKWYTTYIFPGGELPYAREYLTESKDFFAVEDVQSLGYSYAKTLKEWHVNFLKHWEDKLQKKYGPMQGGKFFRMWIFYLVTCRGLFDYRVIQLHQIVYTKYNRKEEYVSVR